ncbi:uncharacterized protein LOC120280703 [Dioscorea cayenensis subsp. rotundata]|uniref:Uncharacterized protein LOC120280703 n=1 Tax=Dioscorea cayennensis subsp. rotundata TaxID=55577 RepID=A0AB40CTZ3_DIOCR|nr:uncharacterized protein LOC120280703 [Dioscorea cayenensis subsp. rotundata]
MAEMSAGVPLEAKVRVVKCPKCEKLLPELPNFTVYKCGGCNATLQAQAKKQIEEVEISPEKSDGGKFKVSVNSEKNFNLKRVGSDGLPETDCEADNLNCGRKEDLVLNKTAGVMSTSLPQNENVMGLKDRSEQKNMRSDTMIPKESDSRSLAGNLDLNVNEMETSALSKERIRFLSSCIEPWPSREGIKFAPYPDEGPSNSYAEPNLEELKRQLNLDQDQGELLRKLDELRDQLRQSCEAKDKMRDRTPYKRAMSSSPYGNCANDTCFTDNSASHNPATCQYPPSLSGHCVDMPSFYQAMHPQSSIPEYRVPFGSQPVGVAPFHGHVQYPQRPCNNYPYGQLNPDHVFHYHPDGLYSQPACSCFHCCNRHWSLPARAPPAIFSGQRAPCIVNNHGLYPVENSMMFGRQSFNHGVPGASLHSHAPFTNKRIVVTKEGRSCRPIAGAAPFVICSGCSKVLELPPKLLLIKKKFKLRCGSCFQIISVEYDGKRLTTTAPVQAVHPLPSDPSSSSTIEMVDGSNFHDPINQYDDGDFDSPIYDVHYTDQKPVLPSFSNSSPDMLDKMQGLSFSSGTSEDVGSPTNVNCQRELPVDVEVPSQVAGQPLSEHFGYLSSDHVSNGSGVGSKSRRSDQENIVSANGNVKLNATKVSVASEIDLSVDDYLNPGSSQDSWDLGREEDQTKVVKGGESFFTGVIKKGIKELRSNVDNGRSKVTINGHLLSDRLVKKAEKKAGPIHPGDYWYDYRAGFWGVMGHPCLGIIPPFIEEFNYPMPKNCAGGNTGVFVNGRELHQKDLDLLVNRGFPPTEGQSYMVEISGKVWDEATGEELESLGKLAPTIERLKHGFGMRVLTVIT